MSLGMNIDWTLNMPIAYVIMYVCGSASRAFDHMNWFVLKLISSADSVPGKSWKQMIN